MTKLEQAARQALEALHNTQNALLFVSGSIEQFIISNMTADAHDDADKAITALREALAEQVHTPYCKQAPMCKTPCGNSDCVEQAEQSQLADASLEPVAWNQQRKRNLIKHWAFDCDWGDLTEREIDDLELIINAVLNAATVRTKDPCNPLQDLTDDEIYEAFYSCGFGATIAAGGRAVIAADRELNK